VKRGFLRTGAPFTSDLILVVEIGMGLTLLTGMLLARRRCYRAHAWCQSAVVLLNLVAIALTMAPSFRRSFAPPIPPVFSNSYYVFAAVHAALGTAAELAGSLHSGRRGHEHPSAAPSVYQLQALDANRVGAVVARFASGYRNVFAVVSRAGPV
jgi:hypothetical protein